MKERAAEGRPLGFDDYDVKLGDELRGERATLGKSLLDVQRDLRIKAAYIAAIENCDPDVFPNQGFIAGYVRSYARYLGVNPEETFEKFCAESGFRGVSVELGHKPRKKKDKADPGIGANSDRIATNFNTSLLSHQESVFSQISPSGIASVSLLAALLVGIGYGGWAVLMDIQRVEFAPIDQPPTVLSSVEAAQPEFPVVAQNDTIAEELELRADQSDELYRPQELAIPRVDPRDGPIAAINPDTVGQLKPTKQEPIFDVVTAARNFDREDEYVGPIVTVEPEIEEVRIFATRAAWVRVYEAEGEVLFEAILETGESYTIPAEARAPLLRAGNSGSVFIAMNGEVYGPVGSGTSVAKKVSLAGAEIAENYQITEEFEAPPAPSVATAGISQ